MTYDTKERILHLGVYEKVHLTKREHEFLIALSSGEMTEYEEIEKYLKINCNVVLRNIKKRLIKKTKYQLKIQTLCMFGYRLKNEIYFK